MLSALRAAFTFLTRLPLGSALPLPHVLWLAPLFFPCVGAALGVALVGVDLASRALLPPAVAAVAVVAAWVMLSGALHLDGLCDVFDGIMGGRDRESALRILRDPRAGTAGVTAVVLLLVTKLAALAALGDGPRLRALLLAPIVGRTWLLPALAMPPARPDGLARAFRGPRIAAQSALCMAAAALLAWGLCAGAGLAALAWSALPVGWLLYTAWRRFGGTTGDVCGAAAELAEAMFLVALCSAFFSRGAPIPLDWAALHAASALAARFP